MTAICVDDEKLLADYVTKLCRELPMIDEALSFSSPFAALEWMESHRADLALLDIDMPGMDGMELASRIKQRSPRTAVVFLTGYSQYAVKAFEMHVSGYLLKPVDPQRLAEEAAYALSGRRAEQQAHVEARTFGNFDLLVDGTPVIFKQAKCKELLAYLVDRRGSSVTRPEAFAVLWEDRLYDRPMQKQFDAILRSLRESLRERGVESILEIKGGTLRICPEKIRCDLFRFCRGDASAFNEFQGEYMSGYAWASMTESYMAWKQAESLNR